MKNEKQKEFILNGNLWKVIFYLSWSAFIGVGGVYYGNFMIEILSALPVLILLLMEFSLLRTGITKWQQEQNKMRSYLKKESKTQGF
ncbi:hypothetical protein [Treponema sp. Marseille-Q3903]|uniref:hypothetical protein n=1 Tax=Treponema sp. Marseille-Q3903 TaxID=2766703 RepID=UPI0016524E37|nr:hypothetical protein [Treponema sp. Marseille-Q3903]MBC6712991.1 hypothetical protein [Treponema sp. Marseille-Q3903]